MVKKEEIFEDGDLKDFVYHKDRPNSTTRKYKGRIKDYCMFQDMLPTELLEEAESEAKNPEIQFQKTKDSDEIDRLPGTSKEQRIN